MLESSGSPTGLFAVDGDGTLLDSAGEISQRNLEALKMLGDHGVVRVVATGRSVETARRVLPADIPIDYLVFSTGAGICSWPSRALLHENHLSLSDTFSVIEILREEKLSFMAQLPIPHNHIFFYEEGSLQLCGDFYMRLEAYKDFAKPLKNDEHDLQNGLSQFIVTIPEDEKLFNMLSKRFTNLVEVIRATSPFDGRSIWMELFPKGVSKGNGLRWLGKELGISSERVCVVGNDYNDLSMLREYRRNAYVVANAPLDLCREFKVVERNDSGGVAQAAEQWWKELRLLL